MMETVRIQELIQTSEIAVLIATGEGRIQFANERFREEFGWPAGSLEGTPMIRIIPPSHRDAHNLAFARFLSRGAGTILGQPLVLPLVTGSGETRQAEVCLYAEQQAGGDWLFGATVQAC